MAKYALIIASILHQGGPPVVISGPEIPYDKQRELFKEAMGERVHPEFARIDFIDSRRGNTKHKTFITPAEFKRRELEIARQNKEFADAQRSPDVIAAEADAKVKVDADTKAKADSDAAEADAKAKAKADAAEAEAKVKVDADTATAEKGKPDAEKKKS